MRHKFHPTFKRTSSFLKVPLKRAPAKIGSVPVVLLQQHGSNPFSGMLRNPKDHQGFLHTAVSLLIERVPGNVARNAVWSWLMLCKASLRTQNSTFTSRLRRASDHQSLISSHSLSGSGSRPSCFLSPTTSRCGLVSALIPSLASTSSQVILLLLLLTEDTER